MSEKDFVTNRSKSIITRQLTNMQRIKVALKDPKNWTPDVVRIAKELGIPRLSVYACTKTIKERSLVYVNVEVTPDKSQKDFKTRCITCKRRVLMSQTIQSNPFSYADKCVHCINKPADPVGFKYTEEHAAKHLKIYSNS